MNYTTSFPATENPLSEGGVWLSPSPSNTGVVPVQTTPGFAFGTQDPATEYDSVALLAGTWGTAQDVSAVCQINVSGPSREVELLLNGTIVPGAPGNVTLYEADFIIAGTVGIVRWDNPPTTYTFLTGQVSLPGGALVTGDIVRFTNNGSGLLTVYVNGVQVLQVTDTALTGGHPGIGFFDSFGYGGALTDQGFSSMTATDGVSALVPSVAISGELVRRKLGRTL